MTGGQDMNCVGIKFLKTWKRKRTRKQKLRSVTKILDNRGHSSWEGSCTVMGRRNMTAGHLKAMLKESHGFFQIKPRWFHDICIDWKNTPDISDVSEGYRGVHSFVCWGTPSVERWLMLFNSSFEPCRRERCEEARSGSDWMDRISSFVYQAQYKS